jgi:PAS domain S-box-containing protein
MRNVKLLERESGETVLEGIRGSAALLEAVVETMPECVSVIAPDGHLQYINASGLGMIEADSWDRVAGTSTFELIVPEHRQHWIAQHERVCRGERLSWEFDIVGLEGTRRHMETRAAPISVDDGSVGHLAIMRDITARKNTERALQELNETLKEKVSERTRELEQALARLGETERSFALLVDSVTDYALFMLDPTGRIVSWNAGAQRIKGYSAAEIIGAHFSCFYTSEDREKLFPERNLHTAAHEGRFETEGWRVRKDGTRFWANVIIDAIRDRGELVGFAKITRDITERRATEARLREAQKMEAVGQFTGGAAHDFNNLLMAILGSLELLGKRMPDDRGMRALLDNAVQGAKRGASLTQRMLAFARRQELKREAVDLARLVSGMKEFLEHSMGPSVNVETSVPRQLACASTDASQLEIALQNLALNARDAMPEGGTITISAREERIEAVQVANLVPGAYVCVSVTDTGHGMDEATLARATEPFFTTKGVGKGTGLGLSMVDGLTAQSGGRLIVQSQLGRGTTVEIWLPIATEEPHAVRDIALACPSVTYPVAGSLVILAVDDDNLVLMNVAAMLEDLGHKVIDVGSGAKALEIIDAGTHIDMVISDQAMPGMTGVQLLNAIKARRPDLPVILATGFAELPAESDASIRRLAKPFTQRELADAVTEAVR